MLPREPEWVPQPDGAGAGPLGADLSEELHVLAQLEKLGTFGPAAGAAGAAVEWPTSRWKDTWGCERIEGGATGVGPESTRVVGLGRGVFA